MMVSTNSQYITDFVPSTMDGKSPLQMLAKTCETIGLPDVSAKKTPESGKEMSPDSKKGQHSPSSEKKKERSPRTTPSTSKAEPMTSTSFPGMKPSFPMMGFPAGFPFYPQGAMMPFGMPAFPSFAMHPMMGRVPCPSAMMRQPCVTPGCTSCSPDLMSQFNPLMAYAAMMPSVSTPTTMPSYQSLLASAAAAATSSAASSTTSTTSTPDKSSVRYKPYSKPSPATPSLSAMPPAMAFNPMAMHALYAQRMMSMPHP